MKTFTVTKDHIILLKNLHVDSGEYAPVIDQKRPYGDSSVLESIAVLIELRKDLNAASEHPLSEMEESYCSSLHKEMAIVLQIALCTGKFKAGKYQRQDEYDQRGWKFSK